MKTNKRTNFLCVRLSDRERELLTRFAKKQGIKYSVVVREALRELLIEKGE